MARSTVFNINPELMILPNSSGSKSRADFSYRLDSGDEDQNRVIASEYLTTLSFIDISVEGFDKYLYFNDAAQLSALISRIKVQNDAVDLTPFEEPRQGKDSIVAVYGKVSITLADKPAEPTELCRPIYRIPKGKRGELHAIQDVREYISKTWIEECKEALFYSGDDAVKRFGVVKRLKDSDQLQLKLLKGFLGVALLVIVIIGLGAVFNKQIGASATAHTYTPPISSQAAVANTLMEANSQQPTVVSNHPAAAVYGGGFTGQEGHNTVDDFAKLQVEQTQSMLKEMGVDVAASQQSLGCFAGGNS